MDNKQLDVQLIEKVKESADSTALNTLIDNTTGIYINIIDKYSHSYPNVIKKDELVEDRMFNIYRFILDYDVNKGTKLSTYVGDRTDWMCKEMLKKSRNNPIKSGTYGFSGAYSLGAVGDTYNQSEDSSITLKDNSESANVVESANKDLFLEELQATACLICTDKRFIEIFNYRHFNTIGHKSSLSWREIGLRMNISHEWARSIYNENIELIKQHLNKKNESKQ